MNMELETIIKEPKSTIVEKAKELNDKITSTKWFKWGDLVPFTGFVHAMKRHSENDKDQIKQMIPLKIYNLAWIGATSYVAANMINKATENFVDIYQTNIQPYVEYIMNNWM